MGLFGTWMAQRAAALALAQMRAGLIQTPTAAQAQAQLQAQRAQVLAALVQVRTVPTLALRVQRPPVALPGPGMTIGNGPTRP